MQVVLSVVGTSLEAADSSTKENPVWGLLSQTLDSFLFPTLKPHQVCPHFIIRSNKQCCGSGSRDGILGHLFNKRLKSFAPCYSQSLLLADFEENHTYSSLVFKPLLRDSPFHLIL
jgi:hypothetical protein